MIIWESWKGKLMKKFIRSVEIEPVASRLDRGSKYVVLLLHALPFISSLETTTV